MSESISANPVAQDPNNLISTKVPINTDFIKNRILSKANYLNINN